MLNSREEKYFKDLTQLVAPSGVENNVANYLYNEYQKLGFELVMDNIGSIFAFKKSKNPNAKKVMIVAHMDEVGFYISKILENGCCQCTSIGKNNNQSLQSNRVVALNNKGEEVVGVINTTVGEVTTNNLEFDFGFKSIEDVKKAGLSLGSPIVCKGEFNYSYDKETIISKAINDRFGIVLGLELLNEFKDKDLPFDLYVGGSVQGEVASRGALTSSYKINPDLAITLDCLPALENPSHGILGEGVLVKILDRSMIGFKELLDLQIEALKATNSKYQYYEDENTSEAGNIHKNRGGILTLSHSICVRNINTPSSIMRINDYLDAKKSLIYLLTNITNEKIEELQKRGL